MHLMNGAPLREGANNTVRIFAAPSRRLHNPFICLPSLHTRQFFAKHPPAAAHGEPPPLARNLQ